MIIKGILKSKRTTPSRRLVSWIWTAVLSSAFMVAASTTAAGQAKTIRGKITSDGTLPIAGASVMIKGTQTGTTTDQAGEYTITASKGTVLVMSFVGYLSKEITVGDNAVIDVELAASRQDLADVVVIGYGTQRKEAITGSVASINGDKLREVPSPNITQSLQGRLAGVDISQTSTRPGATMQIRIRGTRSLSADNNPLIVLDGIPFIGSLADINPNDIKSVDVLKDASATAIYGSRGANGVIIVTTEKGGKNRKPRITYSGYYGAQNIFAKYPMMDGPQFVAYRKVANSTPRAQQYLNGQDEADSINTDWQDLLYQTGLVTDHNISLSGGTETGSYNFGGGYYLNQGVIPTQQYKRYSFRGSIDQQVGKYVRVGFTSNNNFNQSQGNQVGIYSALSNTPIASPYNADGSPKRYIRMAVDNSYIFTKDVVERLKDNGQWLNNTEGYATYNAVFGEVQAPFLKGLKYRINVGLDYVQSNNGGYTGSGVGDALNPNTISSASVDNRITQHWTVENILSYDKTFGGKHTVNAVALYSAEQNKYTRSNMSATDIPSDALQYYNLGQAVGQLTIDPANQDYQLWGLMSGMGRVMYAYDNRYMISGTLRSDASSRLAPGNKWHTYPAVSVGWNISNESFMEGVSAINNLKLRAGFGQTSNQAVAPYSTLGRLDTRPYNFGPTGYAVGFYVNQLPNANLGWEYSKTVNVGLDFSLFKNRLSGTVEYYVTKTEDILLGLSLPPTSGVSSITSNVGTTENKGFELALNGTIINNQNGWTWDVGVNFYTNKNKLTSLASGQTKDEGNWWFVGHNINAIYDYKKVGIWNSAKDSTDGYLNVLEPGGNVGMIKVEYTGEYDASGKPVRAIGTADRQIIDVDPEWQGGFNTRVAFKGFDLGVVGMYRHGGVLFSTIHGSNGYLNLLSGRRNNINVDYWTPDNTDAKYPRPGGILSGDNPKYGSTLSYFDGSFLKIRAITLGYDFNQSLMKNSAAKLRMYFTAQNPFVFFSPFHDESGLDPETNSFGNENASVNLSQNLRRILTVGYNTPSTRNYSPWSELNILNFLIMKLIIKTFIAGALLIGPGTGCKKILDEEPRSIYTPEFFKTEKGILGGITSQYAHLRFIYGQPYYYNTLETGTDEYTWGSSADQNFKDMDLSGAGNITAASSRSDALWGTAFANINTASGIIENAASVPTVTAAQVAEARFFRAFDFFLLVQTFGGVPLDLGAGELKFNTSASRGSVRNTVPEVYTKAIFPDLIQAVADLPIAPRATGTATKNLARLYLAKAYLTYAWWLQNPNNIPTYPASPRTDPDGKDAAFYFQQAYDIATQAIDNPGSFGLENTFYDLHVGGNDRNKEMLLYADHTQESAFYNGAPIISGSDAESGNGRNGAVWMVTWNYTVVRSAPNPNGTGSGVSSVQREAAPHLGRPYTRMAPPIGPFLTTFADKTLDSRYDGTFATVYRGNWPKGGTPNAVLYNANDLPVVPGDPIITFLEDESQTPNIVYPSGGSFPGKSSNNVGAGVLPGRADFVVNPRGISRIVFPNLWKMGVYRTDNGNGLGQPNATSTRPFKIAKFSELYFIAAEAAVKGATTAAGKSARDLLNVIRARAGKWKFSNKNNAAFVADNSAAVVAATPATIDINYILAERSREYFGEGHRWFDLVRTQKWNELAGTYEIAAATYGSHTPQTVTRTIEPKHYIRPIPQGQLDGMDISAEEKLAYQNPGYQ